MKKLLLAIPMLLTSYNLGYCQASTVQVNVITSAPEIFVGQSIVATVQVTNTGTVDLQVPRPDRAGFNALLSTDNPQLGFSGGVSIISVSGEAPMVSIKPGDTVSTKVSLSGLVHGLSPITFRMGFKTTADSVPIWSNPVTIQFKKDEDFPVKIEASIKENHIDISNIQNPQYATAHVRIKNISNAPLDIGTSGVCCLHELQSLISDNQAIVIHSGVASCKKTSCGPGEVTLGPGEIWEQECRLSYWGEDPNPEPISFRIGVKNVGHVPAWGNPVTINIVGGTCQWTKHITYLNNSIEEQQTTSHPDGLNKTYYESGAIMDVAVYKGNKLNGSYRRYHPNGQLWQELHYVNGKRDGSEKQYDETGKLSVDEFYSNGQLVRYTTYNKDSSIHGHVNFMMLENGNYVPLSSPCTEDDSDREVLRMMPRCNASGNE